MGTCPRQQRAALCLRHPVSPDRRQVAAHRDAQGAGSVHNATSQAYVELRQPFGAISREVLAFDAYAKPTQLRKSSPRARAPRPPTTTRILAAGYWAGENGHESRFRQSDGANACNATTGALESVRKFGLQQQSMSHNADGAVTCKSGDLANSRLQTAAPIARLKSPPPPPVPASASTSTTTRFYTRSRHPSPPAPPAPPHRPGPCRAGPRSNKTLIAARRRRLRTVR